MIVVTVFISILIQMEFHLVQNRKENCHHDHIPFNFKGNGNIVFSVYRVSTTIFVGSGKSYEAIVRNPTRSFFHIFFINGFLNPNYFCHTRLIAMKIVFTTHIQKYQFININIEIYSRKNRMIY